MNTKFKNILITGASSGIGRALAIFYARNGAKNLFLCGRNAERLAAAKEECAKYAVEVHTAIVDTTDRSAVQKWIDDCNKVAELNLVIANAGVASLEEKTANIYRTFDTNVYGVLNTILPTIEIYGRRQDEEPRAIAMLSSIAGYHGLAGCPSYSASKACVKAYGEALRVYLRPQKIQVNVICPGFVKSGITDKNTCPMPFLMSGEKAATIIAGRLEKNVGLIAFPWPMRLAVWFLSILPNRLSSFICSLLPYKV